MENSLVLNNENNLVLNGNKEVYHTLDLQTKDDKIKLYNSLQQCDILLNDIKNTVIEIEGAYIESKILEERDEKGELKYNEKTGEVINKRHYRIILFGTDGKTYVSSATGVYNSIIQIINIFGKPSKDNKIKVKISEKSVKNSQFKSLILLYVND